MSLNLADLGLQVVFASPAIHELLGVTPEEAEGRDWADFIHRTFSLRCFTNANLIHFQTARDLGRLLTLMQTAVENTASSDPTKSGSSSAPEHSGQGMSYNNYEVSQARSSVYEPINMSTTQSAVGGFVGPGTTGTSLIDYVRMKDKMGKEVLFELKGHAHMGKQHAFRPFCHESRC